jgi:hypothetical protein
MNNFEKAILTGALLTNSAESEAKNNEKDPLDNKNKIELSTEDMTEDTSATKEKTAQYEKIVVSNENDPRLKSYRDSLEASELTDRFLDFNPQDGDYKYVVPIQGEIYPIDKMPAYKGIQPSDNMIYHSNSEGLENNPFSEPTLAVPIFNKPKQEVVYKEPSLNPKYQEVYENPTGGNHKRKFIGYKTQDKKTGKFTYYYNSDYELGKNGHQVSEIKDLYITE